MKASTLLLACLLVTPQAPPPRPAPTRDTSAIPTKGTATIRGRIVSADGERPLHRVKVTLDGALPNLPSGVTDTRGEYEIIGIPAGTYAITATRAGFLTIQYGQRRPRELGWRLDVADGQTVEQINFAMPRGGVLAGRVFDDTNDPYAGVRVEAVEYRYLRGRRVLLQSASATTNDLGEYRISGLQPGTYFVRATSIDTWESDDGKNTFTYAVTHYPGVTETDQARTVSVAVGQEVGSLDFGLRSGRTARIHGVFQSPAGEALVGQMVSLDRATRGVGGARVSLGFGGGPSRTDANGAFEFRDLAPGEYVVYSGSGADRTAITVIVSDGDVRSVSLAPRKPSVVSGTIVSDEDTPFPFPATLIRLTPIPAGPESLLPSFTGPGETATVARDGTFRITNIDGPYVFRLTGLPSDWMLSAVRIGGKDVTDVPFDVPAGGVEIAKVQIVLSRKGAKVDGQVVTAKDEPTGGSTVLVFAANSSRWTLASRFIRAVRPDNKGRFSVTGLPPGTYRAIARDFVAEGQWEDPDFLNSLAAAATRLELAEGGSQTVTLKLEQSR